MQCCKQKNTKNNQKSMKSRRFGGFSFLRTRVRIDNEENLQNGVKTHHANRYFDKKINYHIIE